MIIKNVYLCFIQRLGEKAVSVTGQEKTWCRKQHFGGVLPYGSLSSAHPKRLAVWAARPERSPTARNPHQHQPWYVHTHLPVWCPSGKQHAALSLSKSLAVNLLGPMGAKWQAHTHMCTQTHSLSHSASVLKMTRWCESLWAENVDRGDWRMETLLEQYLLTAVTSLYPFNKKRVTINSIKALSYSSVCVFKGVTCFKAEAIGHLCTMKAFSASRSLASPVRRRPKGPQTVSLTLLHSLKSNYLSSQDT